jgi:hypothetical protein
LLSGLAAERVDDFGDLLEDIAFVFGGVFVAVGLADDLAELPTVSVPAFLS